MNMNDIVVEKIILRMKCVVFANWQQTTFTNECESNKATRYAT